jgi:hypothetical protein
LSGISIEVIGTRKRIEPERRNEEMDGKKARIM